VPVLNALRGLLIWAGSVWVQMGRSATYGAQSPESARMDRWVSRRERHRNPGFSVSLRRASHDGGACVSERAADPLHRARVDTEPLGNLTDAFSASRLV
jgi:hypothetical protein